MLLDCNFLCYIVAIERVGFPSVSNILNGKYLLISLANLENV